MDEAEEKLKQAYAEDPSNVAAYQYLQAIRQKKIADASRQGELARQRKSGACGKGLDQGLAQRRTASQIQSLCPQRFGHTGMGRQTILSKLDRIHIDTVKYDDLPLSEVINNLSEIAKQRDPDQIGINFYH